MSSAQNYIFQGLAMLFLPQTPQYLMIKKRDTQAEAIIKKLKLSTNVRQTMTDIRLNLTEESNASLCQAENNMNGRMLIGIGLVMAQQLTGTDSRNGNVYNIFQLEDMRASRAVLSSSVWEIPRIRGGIEFGVVL